MIEFSGGVVQFLQPAAAMIMLMLNPGNVLLRRHEFLERQEDFILGRT